MDTSKITEYNYITGVYQFLLRALGETRMNLQKHPGHVTHLSAAEKIKHDIQLIEPILKDLQSEINKDLQDQTGGNFQFLIREEAKTVALNGKA